MDTNSKEKLKEKHNERILNEEDDLINNILPSYHMHQSTISKNLTPTNENFRVDPPMYEMTPVNSLSTTPSVALSAIQSPTSNSSVDEFPFPNQEIHSGLEGGPNFWENTILANAHKLPNLNRSDNKICQDLEIDMKVTEKVCQKGVKPTIIDPSEYEFKQGDYIHGYVTMKNKSPVPISFDMVYVVFEGMLVVLENNRGLMDVKKPSKVHKFLTMLDLFASWSYANIARLSTDDGDPHDWCYGETDPYDNTVLSIDVKRFFQPNVTYKRFFTFKIPEKLLDNTCEEHTFSIHTEIPPSIGISRTSTTPSSLLVSNNGQIKDFSILDTSISYSVNARVIGKASDYKHSLDRDQYVVAKEATCSIRVIPQNSINYIHYNNPRNQGNILYYKAFVDSIKSKIEYGNALLNLPSEQRDAPDISPSVSRDGSFVKLRQLYTMADHEIKRELRPSTKQFSDEIYQCLAPFKRKSLTGSSKTLGVISLSTPKEDYRTLYIPPVKFRKPNELYDNTKLTIPLDISYFHTKSSSGKEIQFPEVKYLKVELVALTMRSSKYPIPLEFTHEMCFKEQEIYDKKQEPENFDSILIKQFQSYLLKLKTLLTTLGSTIFKVETSLMKDINSLATLSTKYINLQIPKYQLIMKSPKSHSSHTSIATIPWEQLKSTHDDYSLYSKTFDLNIDLKDCQMKGPTSHPPPGTSLDHFTLVPTFQTCFMSRLYYLKIGIKINTGELLTVNVPMHIEN
ncbi:DEHA2D09108p [Debaryomyces hansenii CBS767]|uniref:DEHA2D09108p n=1 Tax=Debaryomyces hansenii (strain ATCC 36239 / CBS 767 / BCRC 21394 / JCM 1990 / NBRC 0083 / IGC 2968) TaxID=284592 RepID=Q6BSG0_DEBHA|nr:DEHA2D09108p [Debaryomyces hansenii CBS767]CAG87012.2 DEHA2D09108p [Debaryomyces hansenii CBS767]|eukprot:XP_458860.2 DEHA2D09108p [Debaryomyces hansenii CBS767]